MREQADPLNAKSQSDAPRERPLRIWRWVALLVAFNLVWRAARYGLGFPMWGDEAFVAVNFLDRNFAELVQPLTHYQIVPLLYLWVVEAVSLALGSSEYALRLPAFVAGVASMLLFVPLARRLLPRHAMLASVAVFSASYYPVRHAAEVKPYSGDLMFAVLLLLAAWWTSRSPGRMTTWLVLGALSGLAVWASYPAVFVAGGVIGVLALDAVRRREPGQTIAAAMCGVTLGVSFIAMYVFFGAGQAEAGAVLVDSETWSSTFPPIREPWRLPLWFLDIHTGAMFAYPVGGKNFGSAATFLLVIAGSVSLWRGQRQLTVLLLLSPLPLMFIAAALEKYPYGGSARVAQHLAPAICLLAGAGVVTIMRWFLSPRRTIGALRIFLIVMVVFVLIGIGQDVGEPVKKPADRVNKETVHLLAEQTPDNAVWIIFGDIRQTTFAPDFRTWGGSAARFRFNVLRFAPVEVRWAPNPDSLAALPSGPVWLIVYRDNDKPFPEEQLTPYVSGLTQRFGERDPQEFPHGERSEAIILYRFE